ncbi:hypothetical protein [Pyruvatibacter sp.]|uniref:hypothetical protein n=1 Tax=Pyruvatibacter sp. TaxID=1981328 RepID=UPI0032EE890C
MSRRLVLALAGAIWCAGCASHDVSVTPSPSPAQPVDRFHPDFAPGLSILEGFDEQASNVEWRTGDAALYGILVADGDQREVRFAMVRVLDDVPRPESESDIFSMRLIQWGDGRQLAYSYRERPIEVRIHDADGRLMETKGGALAKELAAMGLWRPAAAMEGVTTRKVEELTDEQLDGLGRGLVTLGAIMDSIQGNSSLFPLMMRIVKRPSLLGLLGGVSITVEPRFRDAIPSNWRGASDRSPAPAYRVPLIVRVNGEVALDCLLDVTPARSPLHVGAGIVRVEARNPSRPDKWALVELLAARRGAAD